MREKLKKIKNERITVVATVSRYGTKKAYKGNDLPTVLLTNIKDAEGNELTDHLWINLTKGYNTLGCSLGDKIQFNARVKDYTKGYRGHREDVYKPISVDYKLSHPTQFLRI
ncbi:hypothetical protein [Cytophaga hutchinsonii]|uniref:Single-stranded DNA-binding protein n=1 Tax=Cytophaga hutchinsonii (strain ATCC 33406 / DSM 1761 / CIP 103989 / NBRC 15051 / NCIMB 9469 / D465) TaxID=269798 RepID=A0A6N4SUP3_CYTH3|nr:hypothetical protein [Cytophaga hutchinsonii]ABG60194.1 conserved hypothetical protein [Cytophaga hutchinsonii ATCC 33406]SFX22244.1 hypothetical protein SAMN04487930_102109 [Cytophaga hutchinsonii ATCC 33406]